MVHGSPVCRLYGLENETTGHIIFDFNKKLKPLEVQPPDDLSREELLSGLLKKKTC